VAVNVTSATAGSITNTTTAPTTTGPAVIAGTAASAALNIYAKPTVSKAFTDATISSGGSTTLTLTLTNPNALPLTGVAIADAYPVNLRNLNTTTGGTCTGTKTASANATNPGTLTLVGGSLAANTSCTITVTVTSPVVGTYPNTTGALTSTETPTADNTATDTLNVVATGLALTKTFSQTQVQAGPADAGLNMSFTITNLSILTAAQQVVFSAVDTMPTTGGAQMMLTTVPNSCTITAANPAGSCGFNGVNALGTTVPNTQANTALQFATTGTGLTLDKSATCTVTCPVTIASATTGGTYSNTAAALNSVGVPGTAGDTASVTALKPPTISQTFSPDTIGAGLTSTLTFTINNTSTDTVAYSGATFSDTLTNISIAGNQAASGTCGGVAGNSFTNGQTGLITLSGLTIPAGSSCTVILLVTSSTVGANANTTSGIATTQTPTAGSGAAAASLTVVGSDLTKTFSPTAVKTGASSTVTFTITNGAGNPAQSGLAFTETFPSNLVVATPANLSTTCGGTVTGVSSSSVVTLSAGSMALGQSSCIVKVDVSSATAGNYPNPTGNITGKSTGLTYSSNPTLAVFNNPILTKAFGANPIITGQTSTLTFTISNPAGAPAASGITFTDTFLGSLTIAATPNVQNNCGGTPTITAAANSGIFTIGGTGVVTTVGPSTCTISVDVTSNSAGSYPNGSAQISGLANLSNGVTTQTLNINALATVTIVKQSNGGTGSFSFTGGTNGLPANLTLDTATGNPKSSSVYTVTTLGVATAITETVPAGWTLNAASTRCTDGSSTFGTLVGGTLTVPAGNVTAGKNITCTFVNDKKIQVLLVKRTLGGGGPFTFNVTGSVTDTVTLNPPSNNATDSKLYTDLTPGATITFTESDPGNNWFLADITCADVAGSTAGSTVTQDVSNRSTAVTPVIGASIACTFTNVKNADLALTKNTLGGNGTFSFTVSGLKPTPLSANITTIAGTGTAAFKLKTDKTTETIYTIDETALPAGWSLDGISCSGTTGTTAPVVTGSSVSFGVMPGDITLCTYTNSYDAIITVLKTADKATAKPGDIITYTLLFTNTGGGAASNISVSDVLSPYVAFATNSYPAAPVPPGPAFDFFGSGSPLPTPGSPLYFDISNNSITPAGAYDSSVAKWTIPFSGTLGGSATFTIRYKTQVK